MAAVKMSDHVHAAALDLGRLRVLVFVDHVLVEPPPLSIRLAWGSIHVVTNAAKFSRELPSSSSFS